MKSSVLCASKTTTHQLYQTPFLDSCAWQPKSTEDLESLAAQMSNKRKLSTRDIFTILGVLLQTGMAKTYKPHSLLLNIQDLCTRHTDLLANIGFIALIAAITGLFRGSGAKARTYKQHVLFSAIKCLTSKLPGRLLRQVSDIISQTFSRVCKYADLLTKIGV